MAYAYEKLISDKNLKIADLPEEVQFAIEEIAKTEKVINLFKKQVEKKGGEFKVSPSATKKIKSLDTFAVRGIQDYLLDKEPTEAAPVVTSTEIIEQVKLENNPTEPAPAQPKEEPVNADIKEIEHELASLEPGVYSLDDLKSKTPTCYKLIFDGYDAEGENGIETSRYKLIETEKEKFTLKKK